jgi:superfamily II DNA or RNA helicase
LSGRTFGALAFQAGKWAITEVEPHVVIRLKALFPKIPRTADPPFVFPDTPEVATDLDWFTNRFPLELAPADRMRLRRMRVEYERGQAAMAQLFAEGYRAPPLAGLREGFVVRPYQAQAVELLSLTGGLLLGDEVGLGKTYTTCAAMLKPGALPGVVVCHAHLQKQWCEVIETYTTLTAHAVRTTRPYTLPGADVRVFRYSQLAGWSDLFDAIGVGLVAFDEIQDLRHGRDTDKGKAAYKLSRAALRRLGLSATPIYNYGAEVHAVLGFVAPGVLDTSENFNREWCSGGQVKDPKALGTYLREQRVFLRRTKADIGQQLPAVNRIVDVVDHDGVELRSIDDLAHELAVRATTGAPLQRGEAVRMLDLRVRHATGVSKAKAVAAIARILVEGGEPIVLVGWHRAVYETWLQELRDLKPALYTGSETAAGKNAAKDAFLAGETDVLIMSLRSGAGLDGLQARCSTMVFGELDWSPGIHHQCIGRLDREGQTKPVTALFLVADDGSDPPMMEVLGLKASQASQIVDPSLGVQTSAGDGSHLKRLVDRYLERRHGAGIGGRQSYLSRADLAQLEAAGMPPPAIVAGGEGFAAGEIQGPPANLAGGALEAVI